MSSLRAELMAELDRIIMVSLLSLLGWLELTSMSINAVIFCSVWKVYKGYQSHGLGCRGNMGSYATVVYAWAL